jgi:hypothetical protein
VLACPHPDDVIESSVKIPIKKYVMDESLSWEERYRQLESHHAEETVWMHGKLKEQQAELQRVQRLPTLEWARVCANIMQRLAAISRRGTVSDSDRREILAVFDEGKTYVSRLEAELDAVKQCQRKQGDDR